MRKVDIEEEKKYTESGEQDEHLPLLSQNISVIEVGAYSQIFEKFIDFLGIKSLVITDIDSIKEVDAEDGNTKKEACPVVDGVGTSNTAIRHYFPETDWNDLKQLSLNNRLLKDGGLLVAYQIEEQNYHARSFEDAFIHLNKAYLGDNKESFRGLQNKSHFDNGMGAYELAEKCIKKKTHFALDILYHSNDDFSNWKIPAYIKEGLLWLKKG